MNISDMLYSLYLFEGFKDDVLSAYQKKGIDVKSNSDFMNAVSVFNSNSKVKDHVKKQLGSISNIGYGVADRFSPEQFIALVNGANQEQIKQNQKGIQKSRARQAASSVSDDFYVYPCRTFEEAHRAAFSHTGNLKRLPREEREKFFKEQYGIDIPGAAAHYQTNMTPAQMLKFMKECPVFMEPTWCVCGAESFFNGYKLKTEKNEHPRCFIFISKTYPNVRFCVTINAEQKKIPRKTGVTIMDQIGEFRDPWQVGGTERIQTGQTMFKMEFGSIKSINELKMLQERKTVKWEDLQNGYNMRFNPHLQKWNIRLSNLTKGFSMFKGSTNLTSFVSHLPKLTDSIDMFNSCTNLTSFSAELPSLTDSRRMFEGCASLKSFTSELPILTNGAQMFCRCTSLTSFNTELPSLTEAVAMFKECTNLTSFASELPNLTNGHFMFCRCTSLKSFSEELPNLTNGSYMFDGCASLKSFSVELPHLTDGEEMFIKCTSLKSFTSELPNLTKGSYMFQECRSLKSFTSELPHLTDSHLMFYGCTSLTSFSEELPNLTNGAQMFDGCVSLKSFTSELPNLTNGSYMFRRCASLKSFSTELPNLTNGKYMFSDCKLDKPSVLNILGSIPKGKENSTIHIGCGFDPSEIQKTTQYKQAVQNGWEVLMEDNR